MGLQEGKFAYKAVKPHNDEERQDMRNVSSIDEDASETSRLILDSGASTWQAVANMTSSGVPNERYYRNPFISNLDDKWACAKVFSVNF